MQKLQPFYCFFTIICKLGHNSWLLIFLTSILLNITISQRILIFEIFNIFYFFSKTEKMFPIGKGGGVDF